MGRNPSRSGKRNVPAVETIPEYVFRAAAERYKYVVTSGIQDVAAQFGIPWQPLRRWMIANGYTIRPKGGIARDAHNRS